MATTKKKSAPAKQKTGLIAKLRALVPGKKATPGRAIKNALKEKKSAALELAKKEDPAHSPGHRKLKLLGTKTKTGKSVPQNESALNHMSDKQRIAREKSAQRRIITGAALGKHGQQR